MKTKTTISGITHEDLVNLSSTALYGSAIFDTSYNKEEYLDLTDKCDEDCIEDKLARLLLAGKSIVVSDLYAEDERDKYGTLPAKWDKVKGSMNYALTLEDIKKGIELALNSGNEYHRDCAMHLIDGGYDFDLPEAEAILQIIVFGEEIYG